MCRVFVFSNVVYSPDTSNHSKRSNLYTACCTVYQFNFASFDSRRGRTSAQMGCLAITPSLMRWFNNSCPSVPFSREGGLTTPWLRLDRLRCRRRTTNSFNANESAKHASFIQYALCHISRLGRCGPYGGCR